MLTSASNGDIMLQKHDILDYNSISLYICT